MAARTRAPLASAPRPRAPLLWLLALWLVIPTACSDGGGSNGSAGANAGSNGGTATPGGRSAGALEFVENAPRDYEYGQLVDLPAGFGQAEFTVELWIRPDDAKPVGSTDPSDPNRLANWSDSDEAPYSSGSWWYRGNFLIDGHNNADFKSGTFSLQMYGGGRLRWLFGDGEDAGPGGHWGVLVHPAGGTPSLLDGLWHHVALVRRFTGLSGSTLELWIDGTRIAVESSPARTDMSAWWNGWSGFPAGQEGWFIGSEKQAAIGLLDEYEDYKGLVDELRLWSRARTTDELTNDYDAPIVGSPTGLVARFTFSEGGGVRSCDELDAARCIDLLNADPSIWSAE